MLAAMSGQRLDVRRATLADAEVLCAFNAAMALETEGRTLDSTRLRRGIEHALTDAHRGSYWVCAGTDGRVVGALLVTLEWSDWRDGWFWWIQSVYVRPEARGHGAYRALWQHVLAAARAAGDVCGVRLYVDQENRNAQAVYEHLGMQRARYALYEVDFVLGAERAAD
jgi:ribosomal protein S18 acetylase RimI-like enzyme